MARYTTTSFVPPELPEMGPRYPDSILLGMRAYISDRQNATVAHGSTSDGDDIQVSIFAAEPPAVSHLCVHCPGKDHQIRYSPAVVCSRDDLIFFNVTFGDDAGDCFIYKADPKKPSLERIPRPESYIYGHTGLVRCRDTDHYAVASLLQDVDSGMFKLSVYSSKTGAWSKRLLPFDEDDLPMSEDAIFRPTKVIELKGSILGWVDLWWGIFLVDVLDEDSQPRYVPLPEPIPRNEGLRDICVADFFRDVCGCGDQITFVEMDYHEVGKIPSSSPATYIPDEWTILTSKTTIDRTSWDQTSCDRTICVQTDWERVHDVDIADITVAESFKGSSDLLPDFCDNEKPSLQKMPIGVPTLCNLNNVVYLMSKLGYKHRRGWVIAVDTKSKEWGAVAKFLSLESTGLTTAYYTSSFTKYLNDTKDNNVVVNLAVPEVNF